MHLLVVKVKCCHDFQTVLVILKVFNVFLFDYRRAVSDDPPFCLSA